MRKTTTRGVTTSRPERWLIALEARCTASSTTKIFEWRDSIDSGRQYLTMPGDAGVSEALSARHGSAVGRVEAMQPYRRSASFSRCSLCSATVLESLYTQDGTHVELGQRMPTAVEVALPAPPAHPTCAVTHSGA